MLEIKNKATVSLLVLRIVLGVTMGLHGFQKLTNLASTTEFFVGLGLPSFMPIVIGSLELIGGIFMIAGLLVPFVALIFVGILGTAILMLKRSSGFIDGYELEVLLIVMSLVSGYSHLNKKIIQFIPDL
ncbi:MAG: DoxX family protein [Vagococcus sp.]